MKILTPRRSLGRFRTCDTAFTFRMGAGFPGDVNRGHPASINPCLLYAASPPTAFGLPAIADSGSSNGVRAWAASDSALTNIFGVTVRPFPFQQSTTNQSYGGVPYDSTTASAPPTAQPVDVLTAGYIMVKVGILYGSPYKGGPVFIFTTTSGGGHILGGFEGATGANVASLDTGRYKWNSPVDASGFAELMITL